MASVFQTFAKWIKLVLDPATPDLPPPPLVLQNAAQTLGDLTGLAISVDNNLDALETWLQRLQSLEGALDSLVVRVLQLKLPRLAGAFTFAGIIAYDFNPDGSLQAHRLDRPRLDRLLSNPGGLLEDQLFQSIFSAANPGALENTAQMTVYLAALAVAPRVLLRLEHDRAGFTHLAGGMPQPDLPVQARLASFVEQVPFLLRLPQEEIKDEQVFLQYLTDGHFDPNLPLPVLPSPVLTTPTLSPSNPVPLKLVLTTKIQQPDEFFGKTFALGQAWELAWRELAGEGLNQVDLTYDHGWSAAAGPGGEATELLAALLRWKGQPDDAGFGAQDGLTLQVRGVAAFFHLLRPKQPNEPFFRTGLQVERLEVGLRSPYLALLGLGEGLKASTNISASYAQGKGWEAQGEAQGGAAALGIDLVRPLNTRLGAGPLALTVRELRARLEARFTPSLNMRALLRFSILAEIGPVKATLDGLGAWLGQWDGGQLGPLPPDGMGVRLEAGPIRGGGFLSERVPGRFQGALELALLSFKVGALAVFERTPQGSLSFITVLGARFPGIQLGFGFMLTGVGGLVGINRRADVDTLAARLTSGAAGNVLFVDDPLKNAPTLLGDLAAFFPVSDGVHVLGPTLQLNWALLVRADLGIFIELPSFSKIIVAGSLRALLGFSEQMALVNLRVDFIGGIDLGRKVIFFLASLVNSSLLGVLSLSGGAAFRLSYGDNSYVALTVGGFHPRFNPQSVELQPVPRLAAAMSVDFAVGEAWLRAEAYFAVTSNSFQLGMHVEAGLEIGPFSAHGFFGFNGLIQFRPFYFELDFQGGFSIEFAGFDFASVNVQGRITGPGPVVIYARARVKKYGIPVSHSATFEIGSRNGDAVAPVEDALAELLLEMKPENLRAEGRDPHVRLRSGLPARIVLPLGTLIWEQKKAPLDTSLERFAGLALRRTQKLQVKPTQAGLKRVDETDLFACGTYMKLNLAEDVNLPAFDSLPSGLRLSADSPDLGRAETYKVEVKVYMKPRRLAFLTKVSAYLSSALMELQVQQLQAPGVKGGAGKVQLKPEKWAVYNPAGQQIAANLSVSQAVLSTRYTASGAAAAVGLFAAPAADEAVELGAI